MEFNLFVWLILGFASYRLTRFLVIDTLLDGIRSKFHVFLVNRTKKLRFFAVKLYELTSCTWCLGFWVSLLAYSLYLWHSPLDFNQVDWVNVFAVTGVQGLLHAFEPDNE